MSFRNIDEVLAFVRRLTPEKRAESLSYLIRPLEKIMDTGKTREKMAARYVFHLLRQAETSIQINRKSFNIQVNQQEVGSE